ncbi:Uma2 family endonuclease [Nocardiopsis baichengensis]|uniref:Uma2 family endonuclease n=1 Tax=Nocardiopsis baichengensis TaxID=280240 RepID=UPI0003477C9F|nr:Uma2 family endonuclease [Nocardiopsis baichengensis]
MTDSEGLPCPSCGENTRYWIDDRLGGLPRWMLPPRREGWIADDLDDLTDDPKWTELIDGALVFQMHSGTVWHAATKADLNLALGAAADGDRTVLGGMTVTLDRYNRFLTDAVVIEGAVDMDATTLDPRTIPLVVEVSEDETLHRDRTVKPQRYAASGIPFYWRVEPGEGEARAVVVHTYELVGATRTYTPTGVHRERLKVRRPFMVDIDLTDLRQAARGRRTSW